MLKEVFNRPDDFVARIGGEEFAIILPDMRVDLAAKKAEEAMARIRKETLLIEKFEIKFTVSMGLAELLQNETSDQWIKRADSALYYSKNHGRDRYTIATALVSAA